MNPVFLKRLLEFYLFEDAFFADLTTEAIANQKKGVAVVRAKEEFVLAGVKFAKPLLELVGDPFELEIAKRDGQWIKDGEEIARISSSVRALLYVERIYLNMLQRMSGIATKTRRLADLIKEYPAKITDTRKTTPGFRYFEKYAVRAGGGVNHRIGLFDAILVKDNHIKDAGSIKKAVELARSASSFTTKIEVECADEAMVEEAVEAKVDIVMLDNMDVESMRRVVERFKGAVIFEASGNIGEDNIVDVARTGVDYISVGALTHHAVWVDINMKLE